MIRNRSTTTFWRRCGHSCSIGPPGPPRPASPPNGWSSTPVSIWARRRTSRWPSCAGRLSLAELGYPLLLSASNKTFLGAILDLDIDHRAEASLAAAALGVTLGCRIVRVHDVARTRLVCDSLSAVMEAA